MPLVPVTGSMMMAGDRLRSLELNHFVEIPQRVVGSVHAARQAVIRTQHMDEPGQRSLQPAAGLPCRGHRAGRGAMIRAIEGDDFLPAGMRAGNLDRVFVRVRSAIREKEDVDIAWRNLRELRAQTRAGFGRHRWRDVGQLRRPASGWPRGRAGRHDRC